MQVPDCLENISIKKIVLIHGEGFGAWCWYKTIALLEEVGLSATALDLTGSGIDLTDTNVISTLAEYSKPLIDYIESLPQDEKVSLHVQHHLTLSSLVVICKQLHYRSKSFSFL